MELPTLKESPMLMRLCLLYYLAWAVWILTAPVFLLLSHMLNFFSHLMQRCFPELLSLEEIEAAKTLISKNIKNYTLSTREIPTGLVSLLILGSVAFGAREVRLLLWVILFWEAVHHLSKALCRPGTSSSI
jgi:hypothetical protein